MNQIGDAAAELPLAQELIELHKQLATVDEGELATYIPPLATADPGRFGLAVVTVDGHCYTAGDIDDQFTIQSVSKPFAFGLALDELGVEALLERVGVEPTGDAFNSITVDEASGRPFNPMVNAGAIVTTSLLGTDRQEREQRLLEGLGRFAGRPLDVDELVFEAECQTGDRNRAIAYLMRNFDMLRGEVDSAVESYFRQCSVLVDVRDLAVMGATLANKGVNPITGQRAVADDHVARVLSVMSACGMYDYAGEWLYRVGLPAKSGVSGGVVAVLPGVLSIASYSPPLDARGNSVRGIRACEALAQRFRLHVFSGRATASAVRRAVDGSTVRSKRRRAPMEAELLRAEGARIRIIELQGPLQFGSAESLSRTVMAGLEGISHLLVDVTRVTSIDDGALPVIEGLLNLLAERGVAVAVAGAEAAQLVGLSATAHRSFDQALEEFEDEVLAQLGSSAGIEEADLLDNELFGGVDAEDVRAVLAATRLERHPTGATIFRRGDLADSIYFLRSGRVRVGLDLHDGPARLTTIGPGGTFGEMAVLDRGTRSSTVEVEADAECHVLSVEALERLQRTLPGFIEQLYRNLAGMLSRRLRDANDEVRALRA
ncbi:MAG TPA: glutaminase A [Acidimicrobiales bacterium]|nr:glutaminase A [Acidimicrobiales bacterium]